MLKRHQPIAGIPAFYTDPDTGALVTNDRGDPATDDDLDSEAGAELDRIALEMCAHDRAAGKTLEPWQLEVEANALRRQWRHRKEASR